METKGFGDQIWTSNVVKNAKTDKKSGREGFVRSLISEHTQPIYQLYYAQSDPWAKSYQNKLIPQSFMCAHYPIHS